VKRRHQQSAALDQFVAGKAEHRSGAKDRAEIDHFSRAFDQIAARGEQILDQDRVPDHDRLAEDRQIHCDRPTVPSAQSSKHFVLCH
jgi:hypothetical protein